MKFVWHCCCLALLVLGSAVARAHEFWLAPDHYTPDAGQNVSIRIHAGEYFKGDSYPLIRDEVRRFVVIDLAGERPIKGVDGDDPAYVHRQVKPGLTAFAHHRAPDQLKFETWEQFESYLRFEGLLSIAEPHRQRGMPERDIKEGYSHCAKLLIGVGDGGADRLVGMPLELVAERNPYRLAIGEALPIVLYYNGKPLADVQVSAVSKADPKDRLIARTDAEGRVRFDLPHQGAWLVNAVHMIEPPPRDTAHWVSYWASLTFARR